MATAHPLTRITRSVDPLSPWRLLEQFEQPLGERSRSIGACDTFIGTMRELGGASPVSSLYLDHNPGMTEGETARLVIVPSPQPSPTGERASLSAARLSQ